MEAPSEVLPSTSTGFYPLVRTPVGPGSMAMLNALTRSFGGVPGAGLYFATDGGPQPLWRPLHVPGSSRTLVAPFTKVVTLKTIAPSVAAASPGRGKGKAAAGVAENMAQGEPPLSRPPMIHTSLGAARPRSSRSSPSTARNRSRHDPSWSDGQPEAVRYRCLMLSLSHPLKN